MDIPGAENPFGRRFACPCGRTHVIEPHEVLYSDEALSRLPDVCGRTTRGRNVAVLMDARTREAAGHDAVRALERSGWAAAQVVLDDPAPGGSPVCDDRTKEAAAGRIAEADLVLAVGAGVISDLAKWLAWDAARPYVCFATAASMNGYASANVAPTVGGVKTLLRASPPAAVVSTPRVLADAPAELTAAGLGDVLAKSVSSADWQLNHVLFGDYYCEKAVGLTADIEPLYLDRPENIRDRRPEAIEALFTALLLTGAAMTMAETSAPASGAEHLISHALDMMSSIDGHGHDLHGRQVGVGAILSAELYRRVLETESRKIAPPPKVDRAFWDGLAPTVAAQYADKAEKQAVLRQALASGDTWDRLRLNLARILRPPEQVRDVLRLAGAAWRAEDIGCGRERLLGAFLHAHEIRSRFTVLDLAWQLGIMPAAAGEIVDQWA